MVVLGHISKAHGIKGEVVALLANELTHFPYENILLTLRGASQGVVFKVLGSRRHHKNFLLLLEGIADRTSAERLRGAEISVARNQLPELTEEEIYIADLLGLAVYYIDKSETSVFLGYLRNAASPAGQELWEIETESGKSILLPAVPEFVKDIDLSEEKILIDPPAGLLELYL